MPVLCLLSLISRNSPKQLGMVSLELLAPGVPAGCPYGAMPVLCLLSLISRNSPKQLGMVSLELLAPSVPAGWPYGAMPVLCLLSLISRNSPKQLGMVSPELKKLVATLSSYGRRAVVVGGVADRYASELARAGQSNRRRAGTGSASSECATRPPLWPAGMAEGNRETFGPRPTIRIW